MTSTSSWCRPPGHRSRGIKTVEESQLDHVFLVQAAGAQEPRIGEDPSHESANCYESKGETCMFIVYLLTVYSSDPELMQFY